jgi:biotin carboxylase
MTGRRVLLLEASGPESTAITEAAVARGDRVWAVTQPDRWASYPQTLRSLLTGHLLTDLARPEHAVAGIVAFARNLRVEAVLTTNEYLTPLNAAVCAHLGLPGNDPAAAMSARNKATMAARLREHGVAVPNTVAVDGDPDTETRLTDAGICGWPVVVKPAEAAGSAGVTIVPDAAGLPAAITHASNRRSMYGALMDSHALIQEHIGGQEFSVESITQHGVTTHLCLTRKLVSSGTSRVELGHSVPADAGQHTAPILEAAGRAILAAGIRNGASHTEVVLCDDGRCVVIEVAARIGAGYIGFLVQHALGIDPWQMCLDVALGEPARLAPSRSLYATVRFLTSPDTGTLAAVQRLPDIGPDVPVVKLRSRPGDRVSIAADNTGRLGCFIVVGSDPVAVARRACTLHRDIVIQVVPDAVSASGVGGGRS